MFHLLNKELRLAAHPTLFIFLFLGCLVIVPNYPYSTVLLYGCLAPFISFFYARENNDTLFTSLLPVRKRDAVKGKFLMVIAAQIGQLLFSVPFACLRPVIAGQQNAVGIDPNVAYYGFAFLVFAVFDFVFLTKFYKTAYKPGVAFLFGIVPASFIMVLMEVLPHIEMTSWLGGIEPSMLVRQIPILLSGAVIFAAALFFAYRISVTRYEKVDL